MTDESSLPAAPRKPLWRRILKWTCRIVLALILLAVVGWGVWTCLSIRNVERHARRIAAAGEPVTFRQLSDALGQVKEADNAGPLYQAAMVLQKKEYPKREVKGEDGEICLRSAFDEVEAEFTKLLRRQQPVSKELQTKVQQVLDDNRLSLELLDRGGRMSGCDYDLGVEHEFITVWRKMNVLRKLTKLASLRIGLLAVREEGDKAVESLDVALKMNRIFDRQPLLICHLVKAACFNLSTYNIPVILASGHPSRAALTKLEQSLIQAEKTIDLKRMFEAEQVLDLKILQTLDWDVLRQTHEMLGQTVSGRDALWSQAYLIASAPFWFTTRDDQLDKYHECIQAVSTEWHQTLESLTALESRERSHFDFGDVYSIKTDVELTARAVALLRAGQIAARIEQYLMDKHSLPASLEDVQKAYGTPLPSDPFTGKSFIYQPVGKKGYRLYSVGENLKDDGGAMFEGKGDDWGLGVRTPAATSQPGAN